MDAVHLVLVSFAPTFSLFEQLCGRSHNVENLVKQFSSTNVVPLYRHKSILIGNSEFVSEWDRITRMKGHTRAEKEKGGQEKESTEAVEQPTDGSSPSRNQTGVENIEQPEGRVDEITEKMREQIATLYGRDSEAVSQDPLTNVEYILEKAASMMPEQALTILTDAVKFHRDDPNFPSDTMRRIKCLIQDPDVGGTIGETPDSILELRRLSSTTTPRTRGSLRDDARR
jgi:hypothetical protein